MRDHPANLQPSDASPGDFTGLASLRLRLMQEHGRSVDPNDPIMLLFTMHQTFLEDYERLLTRRSQESAAGIEAAGRRFTLEVRQAIDEFRKDTLTEGLASQVRAASALTAEVAAKGRVSNRLNMIFTIVNAMAALIAVTALLILGK
jgi:hypothetical protein